MATASLSTDSPNTRLYSMGSQSSSGFPMMDSVATGSTAEMRAPKRRLGERGQQATQSRVGEGVRGRPDPLGAGAWPAPLQRTGGVHGDPPGLGEAVGQAADDERGNKGPNHGEEQNGAGGRGGDGNGWSAHEAGANAQASLPQGPATRTIGCGRIVSGSGARRRQVVGQVRGGHRHPPSPNEGARRTRTFLREYPASKMIGGSRRKKNSSGCGQGSSQAQRTPCRAAHSAIPGRNNCAHGIGAA